MQNSRFKPLACFAPGLVVCSGGCEFNLFTVVGTNKFPMRPGLKPGLQVKTGVRMGISDLTDITF